MITTACQSQTYTIETSLGNIQIRLYENTLLHKANFEKSVEENAYDSVLFHRIIQGFMIQTGNLATKPNADKNAEEGETVPAEFHSEYFHKKGALAAARIGDRFNPEKKSSPTQFYIVQGRVFSEAELAQIGAESGKTWTDEQKAVYQTLGGTPFLDMDYTVFGEVVEGLDVVDKIAATPTGYGDVPVNDVRILTIRKD